VVDAAAVGQSGVTIAQLSLSMIEHRRSPAQLPGQRVDSDPPRRSVEHLNLLTSQPWAPFVVVPVLAVPRGLCDLRIDSILASL